MHPQTPGGKYDTIRRNRPRPFLLLLQKTCTHPASSTSRLPAATSDPKPLTVPQLAPLLVISKVTPAGCSVTQYSATLMPRVARAALAA